MIESQNDFDNCKKILKLELPRTMLNEAFNWLKSSKGYEFWESQTKELTQEGILALEEMMNQWESQEAHQVLPRGPRDKNQCEVSFREAIASEAMISILRAGIVDEVEAADQAVKATDRLLELLGIDPIS